MSQAVRSRNEVSAVGPAVLSLRRELASGKMASITKFPLGDYTVDIRLGQDSLWAIIRRAGRGGLALRAAYLPGGTARVRRLARRSGETVRLELVSALGRHEVCFKTDGLDLHRLRMTAQLTPAMPLLVPFLPRDLYPLDQHDDPTGAKGNVEAGQRGMNSGLLYFHVDQPASGSVLYFQNLTAMNDYYRFTKTKPDGAVGGKWPELGYLPPSPPQSGTPPVDPLPEGKAVTLSDVILILRDQPAPNECECARQFIQMLGAAYTALKLPPTEYRDWVDRAERTLSDLETSPKATIRHYGNRYAHPYTAAEYPDSMVQVSLLTAMYEYGSWRRQPAKLEAEFSRGLERFYDPALKTIRRYLPNVGKDKDADAVDSWYLYHPLLNLGRLAIAGDDHAKLLFLKSVEFGIRAAHHFKYNGRSSTR